MKKSHILAILVLAGFISLIGFSHPLTVVAQEQPTIDKMKTPEEIQKFRADYIQKFHRTGLNSTVEDAKLIRIMVAAGKCKRGMEIGTATGFGAINMGISFERNGGELYTLDIDPQMVKTAREHIKNTGLDKVVTVIEGDALKTIPTLKEKGEFDFMYIDALKKDYFNYFKLAEPFLKTGAIIVADNVIVSEKEMKDFLDFMKNSPNYDMQIVRNSDEKHDGQAVIVKIK